MHPIAPHGRSRRSARRRALATVFVITLGSVGLGCGVQRGSDDALAASSSGPADASTTTDGSSKGTTTTTAPTSTTEGRDTTTTERTTTTTTERTETTAPPTTGSTPAGFRRIRRDGVDVSIAVPNAWVDSDLSGKDLTDAQKKAAEENPQLGGLTGQASGMFAGATGFLAVGPLAGADTPNVIVAQLGLSLPTIPDTFASAVKAQFESLGATDVTSTSVKVTGLRADQRGLRVDATLATASGTRRLHELLVPASSGIAIVVAQGPDAIVEQVLATIEAR